MSSYDDDKPAKASDDDAIIAECRKRMQQSIDADNGWRAQALEDLAFLAGEHWGARERDARMRTGRPCLTINRLPAMIRQVTNSNRRNVPSILVHPATNDEAARKRADILQGAIRHVEYTSQASVAYDTAVESAAQIGKGYFRLVTRYVSPASFDQEIAFERIRNAMTVYPDPADTTLDGSAMTWCVLSVMLPRADFQAQYPKADPCDYEGVRATGDGGDWSTKVAVRVAEYYRVKHTAVDVVLLSTGDSGYADELAELPPGVAVVQKRKGYRKTVEWFCLTANEVLERAVIPGEHIPVFPVYGDELDIDGKVTYSGMVRYAKDPARMYNYWVSSATEEVALRPRTPYIGAEGQFEGHEKEWAQANTSNLPYLQYKPKALNGVLAPAPSRQPMADMPAGVMNMAQMAADDVKAVMNIFDASMGARSNETSGRAIQARDRQGETANSHYIDNLHTTLRHVGRVILGMWPSIYDGTRTLQIMGEDGKVANEQVNVPQREVNAYGETVEVVLNDMTTAEMSVTVRAGPSYDTMRQEAVEGMLQTAQNWPKFMEVAGDKVIRAMDWPMADQIADRIEKTIPPELRDEGGAPSNMIDTPQGPVPADQVGPMLAQMQQQMQEMGQALQEAQSGLDKAKIDADAKIRVAEITATSRADVEEIKGYVALLTQQLAAQQADIDMMRQAAFTQGGEQPEEQFEQPEEQFEQPEEQFEQPQEPVAQTVA